MKLDNELLKKSYKKLKSSLYYDKTMSIVRDQIVEFESSVDDVDQYLEELAENFFNNNKRDILIDEILGSITFFSFPKKIHKEKSDLVKNFSDKKIDIEEIQYFIDMDIRGHILGVLWLLLIGYRVDKKIYQHSYGNRIRKNLYNEFSNEPTYSPYLFEPYFQQYESWRDNAMNEALSHLYSGQDVVILTLDFERFYYSLDIRKELLDKIFEDEKLKDEENDSVLKALNDFIYKVIGKYASNFDEFNGFNILPIGFLPSNVLANYSLKNFDKAIVDGWNPIYFGRYVDDILIVDKIESNSDLFKSSEEKELTANQIVDWFLKKCSRWKGINVSTCENNEFSL